MFQQDYIMRMVEQLTRAIALLLFGKDLPGYVLPEDDNYYTDNDVLHVQILSMLNSGDINGAENLMFEYLDPEDKGCLEIAVDFYDRINGYSDEYLLEHDYTRQEIEEGLRTVMKTYGITF